MKLFGLRVFTKQGYHDRLRKAKKTGFKLALAEFSGANEVHFGTPVITGNNFEEGKLVVLGDGLLIAHNIFTRIDDEVSVQCN
jgi:hypothetical protein